MEPLIYYPTFEPPSDIWLKFSLLYFENFKPIGAYNRRHLISNNFRLVEQETDLVSLYEPLVIMTGIVHPYKPLRKLRKYLGIHMTEARYLDK